MSYLCDMILMYSDLLVSKYTCGNVIKGEKTDVSYCNDDNMRNIRFSDPDGRTEADMTVEKCEAQCAKYGYPFAGVQYAQQCRCGGILRVGALKAGISACNMKCLGSTDTCGGTWNADVYYNPDLASSTPCR
ncbi:hypothetical protein TWF694_003424 [Orbilia ellipsospora]|uniref:WSC domain-containing protein n=1 Tax=Orbilia ellipsospora TaxID=2528407 RepID=A0AAV9X436_9PEZI